VLCHVEREHGDDTIASVVALPLAAGLGRGEAPLDALQAGFDPVEAQRLAGEIVMDLRDRQLDPGQAALHVGDILAQAILPLAELAQQFEN
jgi:hypothetical protein